MESERQFVARQPELVRLERALKRALDGEGQVCFVVGEAGTGKTVLVNTFARRAQAAHSELIVATGLCDVNTGAADPYLPFREVLNLLVGNIDEKLDQRTLGNENARRLNALLRVSAQVLVDHGPDLVDTFVPFGRLATAMGMTAVKKTQWYKRFEASGGRPAQKESQLDQSHILEQYVNVLRQLAEKAPLLIILDDMHWADSASIDLLFRLCRRLDGSRIMLVGTYRPGDLTAGRAGGRHPLEQVVGELKRYIGDIWVDLNETTAVRGREFVDTYIDSLPNEIDEPFRKALFKHTGGNPLFTVEVLRDLTERGELYQGADQQWRVRETLDWEALPLRVEGVFQERFSRLEPELQEALSVGSVEGEEFTAEVIAHVKQGDSRALIRQLSGPLQREHKLVQSMRIERAGEQRISHYRFAHNLMQVYLYESLDVVERTWLHEDVGNALESLFAANTDRLALQLARHFEAAQLDSKARRYRRRAAELAVESFAYAEAIHHANRALALTPEEDVVERYELLLLRERAHDIVGDREMQQHDVAELARLAEGSGDPEWQAVAALRSGWLAINMGNAVAAKRAAEQALGSLEPLAERSVHLVRAYLLLGQALFRISDDAAAEPVEKALEIAREIEDQRGVAQALNRLGTIAWSRRDYAAAREYLNEALATARAQGLLRREGAIQSDIGLVLLAAGEYEGAIAAYEQSLAIARGLGDRLGECVALTNLVQAYSYAGQLQKARAIARPATALAREIDSVRLETSALINLSLIEYRLGFYQAALEAGETGLAVSRQAGDSFYQLIVLTNLAGIAIKMRRYEAAVSWAEEAIALAGEHRGQHRAELVYSYIYLGEAQLNFAQFEMAQATLTQAVELAEATGHQVGRLEAAAALVRLGMAREDAAGRALAQEQAELIYERLTAEPAPAYMANVSLDVPLAAYEHLRRAGDTRARAMLLLADRELQARVQALLEPEDRRAFLENVRSHRIIAREMDGLSVE